MTSADVARPAPVTMQELALMCLEQAGGASEHSPANFRHHRRMACLPTPNEA